MKISLLFLILFQLLGNSFAHCQSIGYDKIHEIACHNCFETQYAQKIEDVFQYTNSIELDIWDSKIWFGLGGYKAMNNNWFVRHMPTGNGNNNCCGGSLKDCLTRINNWSLTNPNHDAITIFIDKKENWSESNETRKPEDLDNLIYSIFEKNKIFSPSLLVKKNRNLREAILKDGWPSINSLKGKIIIIITNGSEITSRNLLDEYLQARKNNAACFVAPEVQSKEQIIRPDKFSKENKDNVICYNLKYGNQLLLPEINLHSYLSRIYGAPENKEIVNELINLNANFIALFNYKIAP